MGRQTITDGYGAPSEHIALADRPRAETKDTARRMLDSKEADSLPHDELLEHIARYQRDREDIASRNRALMSNLRLVRKIARTYLGRCPNFEIDDLMDEGVLGLMNAIETFDRARAPDGEFHPYAARLIRQAIKEAIVYSGQDIRRSRRQYDLYGKIAKFQSLFLRTHGIPPSTQEIAEGIGVPIHRVQDCLVVKAASVVISETVVTNVMDRDPFTIEPRFPGPTPFEWILAKERSVTDAALHERYLATLRDLNVSDRDREIFERRVCLNGYPRYKSLKEIGELFDLSGSSIQQISSRVARRLSFALKDWGSDDWLRMSHANTGSFERAIA